MPPYHIPPKVQRQIDLAVEAYKSEMSSFAYVAKRLAEDLLSDANLHALIHSSKFRHKDPVHLADKLERKAIKAGEARQPFTITARNVLEEIEDLAGVRLLHIHTQQIREIHPVLCRVLSRHKYTFVGKPIAYTWDIENKALFQQLNIVPQDRESFYTSIHYIVRAPDGSKCEIQVRTLAEELWGEVSHSIAYPSPIESIACKEQLMALARVASGCTRLVDSIIASKNEFTVLTKATESIPPTLGNRKEVIEVPRHRANRKGIKKIPSKSPVPGKQDIEVIGEIGLPLGKDMFAEAYE
ncbi:MAG: RelA/SpoT domain-containing protein [Planctomycetaceae bacterium]|nr:RelA/SpoT domain-containing protein [Planctomycetaceae bacterium]